jgi:hypothetical protein
MMGSRGYGAWVRQILSKFIDLRQVALFEVQSVFSCLGHLTSPCCLLSRLCRQSQGVERHLRY